MRASIAPFEMRRHSSVIVWSAPYQTDPSGASVASFNGSACAVRANINNSNVEIDRNISVLRDVDEQIGNMQVEPYGPPLGNGVYDVPLGDLVGIDCERALDECM